MSINRNQIVKQAQSWLGLKESDGSHKKIINIYNGQKTLPRGYQVQYKDSWCATFVSAVAIVCEATNIIPTECSCQQMIKRFQSIKCWQERDNHFPQPGDIIFYDWQDSGSGDNKGWSDHVGIVEKCVENVITVIEGNYGDAVKRRTIKVNAKNIRGYASPKYDAEPVKSVKKTVDAIAKEVIAGKWGTGTERKQKLIRAGYDYTRVQARVNELLQGTPAPKYYPKYTGNSYGIDTVFKAIGVPATFTGHYKNRRTVAKANGISNYTGTAQQNTKLINLAKQGKLVKP